MSKLKINPRVTRLINYIKDIEEGKLQVPAFQRDFVWGKKEKIELFESLKMGYPIGSLLFWRSSERFKIKEEVGPYRIRKNLDTYSESLYILDGFQRLSTLFGCLINPSNTNLEKNEVELQKNFSMYYDLENEEFIFPRSVPVDPTFIPVNALIDTFSFLDYVEKLRYKLNDNNKAAILIDKARTLSSSILDYQLPSIEIIGGTIEDAVDIFSRINSKGSKISVDWMVSALTYNEESNFRLATKIDELIHDLKIYNFERLKRELVLQCIQASFGRLYFDEKITDLIRRPNFISITNKTINSIIKAVKFLFEHLFVIDLKLLPYNNQLIFITYFFNEVDNPSYTQLSELKRWFWITTYSNYFTIYSLSKQRIAFTQFKNFVTGIEINPVYNDKPNTPFSVTDFPLSIHFGSVRAKALILFLLNYANDFLPIDSSRVDELKIFYLLEGITVPESVIAAISYTPEFSSANLVQSKQTDLSYLLDNLSDEELYEHIFINREMIRFFQINNISTMLSIRKDLITQKEREFTIELGLDYE